MVTHNVISDVLGRIPRGAFLMTAAHDDARTGVLTPRVQLCSEDPCLVMVSSPRGTPIEPLLRDSRCFGLCRIMNEDRLVERRFNPPPLRGDDPYVAIPTSHAVTGAPILHRCEFYMDCELVGHLAPDADCRIYLGLVKALGLIKNPADALQFEIIEPSETTINGKKIYAS
jgi:flavin reductase (DIM6/NTAB) family NADH-FMN oxidoreductase RutF